MYDTQTRVKLAYDCAKTRQKQQQEQKIYIFSGTSMLLFCLLVSLLTAQGAKLVIYGDIAIFSGTILLFRQVGGHVLVAVVAISLATTLTLLCMKFYTRISENKERKR